MGKRATQGVKGKGKGGFQEDEFILYSNFGTEITRKKRLESLTKREKKIDERFLPDVGLYCYMSFHLIFE